MKSIQHYLSSYREHYRKLVRLGIPIIIGQLGIIIVGFADTIMVGHHSTEELAAASFVNNVLNAFIILGTGFSYNLTPFIGSGLAQGRRVDIGGWLKNSLWANTTTAFVLVGILSLMYCNLGHLGQPEGLMPLIRPYFVVSALSIFFIMLYNSFRQFVEGIGQPTVSMWVLLGGNVLNVIGNYVLIYGKAGFPEMGLLGAGVSTLVSRVLMVVFFLVVFVRRKEYRSYRQGFVAVRFSRERWRKLNALGWPVGLQQGMEAGTFALTAIMIGWLGSLPLAAHQIAITVSMICYTILLGIGSAVAIRNSFFRGLGNWNAVRRTTFAGIHLGLLAASLICLTLFLLRSKLSLVFTDNREVASIVIQMLPVLMLYQFGDAVQIVFANALRGIADVKPIMWISFLAYFVIAVPCGYLLGFTFGWGCTGIWMAYPIGFLFAGILMGRRLLRQTKRFL